MKFKILTVFFLLISSSVFSQENIVPGEMLVMFKTGHDSDEILKEINSENVSVDLEIIKPISRRINAWHLSYNPLTTSPQAAINLFAGRQDVEIVQYNHNNVKLRDTLCSTMVLKYLSLSTTSSNTL